MKKRRSIIFSQFSTQEQLLLNDFSDIIKSFVYSDENGFGYINTSIDNNILYSTLIKRTFTSILEFSIEINDFKKIDVPIFEEISFCVDFNRNVLYTYGANSNHNKIKSALRNTLETPLIYGDLDSSPINFMERIIKNNSNFNIDEIVIRNFKYEEGVSGKYIAKITNQKIGISLIDKYLKDILKISMNLDDDFEYYLVISSNNAISLKCNEDDFYSILENIKNKIYG